LLRFITAFFHAEALLSCFYFLLMHFAADGDDTSFRLIRRRCRYWLMAFTPPPLIFADFSLRAMPLFFRLSATPPLYFSLDCFDARFIISRFFFAAFFACRRSFLPLTPF
jgi:hypothetical protein